MKQRMRKNGGLTIVISLFIILILNFFQSEVKGFFYNISYPIQKYLWQAGENISYSLKIPKSMRYLQEKIDMLVLENRELMSEIVSLEQLKEENNLLRDALKIGLEKDFQMEIARVISKDLSSDSIIIDKGSKDGLSKDMPLITKERILLGKIEEVFSNQSRVVLISNSKSSFDAEISESKAEGLLRGSSGGEAQLEMILKDKLVNSGELVVSSALSGVFPQGLLIGSVREVEKNDTDPFQTAKIQLFFNITDLKQAFIILDF
jgi:rod shape-determining protein MreC